MVLFSKDYGSYITVIASLLKRSFSAPFLKFSSNSRFLETFSAAACSFCFFILENVRRVALEQDTWHADSCERQRILFPCTFSFPSISSMFVHFYSLSNPYLNSTVSQPRFFMTPISWDFSE